jgi:hypothetical protein
MMHELQSELRGVVGLGALEQPRQQRRRIDGFVYSAAASRGVMKKVDAVIE